MNNLNSNVIEDDDEKIIKICNNLPDLDREYNDWLMRSFDHRKISDGKCLAKYGCTNTELYQKLRAGLLSKEQIQSDQTIDSLPIGESGFTGAVGISDQSSQSISDKIDKANALMDNENIVLINDFRNDVLPDYTEEDLFDQYEKYNFLPQSHKNLSNGYSLSIWRRSVPDMYKYILGKFTRVDDDEMNFDNDRILFSQNDIVQSSSDDIVKQELAKIDYSVKSQNRTLTESVYLESIANKLQYLPHTISNQNMIVPYLTPDEYEDLNGKKIIDPYGYTKIDNQKKYYRVIHDLQMQLSINPAIEEAILKLGWNPYVKINQESINYAKQKQDRWFKSHLSTIDTIKLSEFKTNFTTEDLQDDDPTVLPIYIVNIYHYVMGRQIVLSAGFALSSLRRVYMITSGEVLDVLSMTRTNNDTCINITCFYVNKAVYSDINTYISEIPKMVNDSDEKAGRRIIGMEVDDAIISEINIFANCINSTLGEDKSDRFYLIRNAKLYELYYGSIYNYIPGTASSKAKSLIYCTKKPMEQVQEEEISDTIYSGLIENLFITSYNDKANNLLSELRSIVYPRASLVFNEIRAPFGLDDKGLYINFPKDLQKEYEEAHRLLQMYSSNNLDGIKHELAHLYYLNWVIEKKLKYTKKGTSKYKELIDLRARVLNDFKKYFKLVCEKDPKFDFMEYLKTTEYYTKYMEIDYSTLENIGKIISQYSKL